MDKKLKTQQDKDEYDEIFRNRYIPKGSKGGRGLMGGGGRVEIKISANILMNY